jgi:hypothetical protein
MSYPEEEVNRTAPSRSVSVPWPGCPYAGCRGAGGQGGYSQNLQQHPISNENLSVFNAFMPF